MKKNALSLLLILVMVVSLVGCGNKNNANNNGTGTNNATPTGTVTPAGNNTGATTGTNEKLKLGFAIKTQDSPYFVALVSAVKDLCTQNGWDITVLDANGDTAKEAENMDTFIAQKMNLIFLDSVDPSACIPSINAAADAGIGVINLDSGVGEGSKQVTTVYSDNKQNGRMVGLAYAKKMGTNPINAILLSGAKGNVAGQERREGLFCGIIEGRTGMSEADAWKASAAFDDELTKNGKATNADANFTVSGQGWGAWTREEGLTAAEDLITANPNLTTALGENDQMLFGVMTALTNAGIKNVDIVAAADGAKEAYDLIKQGTYFATGENSPYKVAQLGVQIAKEILVEKKDMSSYPEITLTQPNAVRKIFCHYPAYFIHGFCIIMSK
jgi:ribose transport system substrate-binding protein